MDACLRADNVFLAVEEGEKEEGEKAKKGK